MTPTKIIIAGIGGVGGWFGGLLARHFENDDRVEVNFIARGNHLEIIQTKGLKVRKGSEEFIAKPKIATDDPAEIGTVDLVMICTKTYDLEAILDQLRPCIAKKTVILPLLNGIGNTEVIKKIYPDNLSPQGCVYIVSRLKRPGFVENMGNIQKLFFGIDAQENEFLLRLEGLFREANIDVVHSKSISGIIWEKFIFLSPIATATTAFNKRIGAILEDDDSLCTLMELIAEVEQIAKSRQVSVPPDIGQKTIAKLKSLPFDTTSSMHSDFLLGKSKTELGALTRFVIEEGKKQGIATPAYEKTLKMIGAAYQMG